MSRASVRSRGYCTFVFDNMTARKDPNPALQEVKDDWLRVLHAERADRLVVLVLSVHVEEVGLLLEDAPEGRRP